MHANASNKFSYLFHVLLLFSIYLCLSGIFWGIRIFPHMDEAYIGISSDPVSAIWSFSFWSHILSSQENFFHTSLQWSPFGMNLTHVLATPFLGIISAPFTNIFGPTKVFNLWILLACPLSATSAAIVGREISDSWKIGLISGYFYGFSAYQIGHVMAHLVCVTTFTLPLLLLFQIRLSRTKEEFGPALIWHSIILIITFLISTEFYVFYGFLAFAVLMLALIFRGEKSNLKLCIKMLLYSYLITVLVLLPYIYHFLVDADAAFAKNNVWNSIDFFNLFVPLPTIWLGGNTLSAISNHFPSNPYEAGGYLGLPLVFLLFLYFREFFRTDYGRISTAALLMCVILSFGPRLHILGMTSLYLPWWIFSHFPVLRYINPARFALFTSLMVSVILAYWLKNSRHSVSIKYSLVFFCFLCLVPNMTPGSYKGEKLSWTTELPKSAFSNIKLLRQVVKPNMNILIIPADPINCYYQAQSKMLFNIVNGCLDGPGIVEKNGVKKALRILSSRNTPFVYDNKVINSLFHILRSVHVDLIVINKSSVKQYGKLLSRLATDPKIIDNYLFYRVTHR